MFARGLVRLGVHIVFVVQGSSLLVQHLASRCGQEMVCVRRMKMFYGVCRYDWVRWGEFTLHTVIRWYFFCGHTIGFIGISAIISARAEGYGTTQDFCGEEEERVSQKCNHDC